MRYLKNCFGMSLCLWGVLTVGHACADNAPLPKVATTSTHSAVFARVGDSIISLDQYNATFSAASRGKFYHGKPPDGEIAAMQREVANQMVERILLLREAQQRKLRADQTDIQKTVQTYEQRYAGSAQWKANREQALPALITRLEQDNLLSQIEKTVRSAVKPSAKQVKAYYTANLGKFTEPEQLRASVILLKVDPSAPSATWIKAEEQAKALAKRARAGEDFSALSKQYSQDDSAQQGGDLGYLHGGMLPEGGDVVVAKMKVGETSDPFRILEGVAILRLADRKAPKRHELDEVKVRAEELTQRELSDTAWIAFLAQLKLKTKIQIDQSRFLPLSK